MKIKKSILINFVFILVIVTNLILTQTTAYAKRATFITEKNFIGTFYPKNGYKKATKNHGAYNVTIKKITKSGKAKFYIEYCGRNGSPYYSTFFITAKIKGKKADFKWKDTWGNSGNGIIKFIKRHKISLVMKQLKTAELNRASLAIKKTIFLYYTKWYGDIYNKKIQYMNMLWKEYINNERKNICFKK